MAIANHFAVNSWSDWCSFMDALLSKKWPVCPVLCTTVVLTACSAAAQGILEWYGHCRRQCIEAHSNGLSAQSAEKKISPSFLCCLDGLL